VGLLVAGNTADWPEGRLDEKLEVLGLRDTVTFLGDVPQRQMGALYAACDLMINPSLCESFGFAMIESLGHGLPIVAADLPINREICGSAAVYYPPLDSDLAAQAILDVLSNGDQSAFRRAARARLTEFDWSWRRYAREFGELVNVAAGVNTKAATVPR
jgi:glycosyltransferase involved in cell wall biosynthesis